jgi:thioredoxin
LLHSLQPFKVFLSGDKYDFMRWLASICFFFSLSAFSQKASTVSVDEFEKNLDTAAVQLLDVRKPEEYKTGHLKGAFQADWLDKKEFEERTQFLDKSKPVFVYCLVGGRSAAAASYLAQKGFNVVNMDGGITAWKKENKPVEANATVQQMKVEEYEKLVQSAPLVLVDFSAGWCLPCKKMEPVVNEIEKEYTKVKLLKIDAGVQDDIVKQYNVEGLPVFVLYKNGKEVWRQEGVIDKKTFENAIKKFS